MTGFKVCPKWLKEAYRQSVKFTCQECNKHEDEVGILTIHRIIRGNQGGLYVPSNCKVVCSSCYKKYHQRI